MNNIFLDNLEQNCIRPGFWRIENFNVKRTKPQSWRILNPPRQISYRLVFPTLTEARLWIADELNGAHK